MSQNFTLIDDDCDGNVDEGFLLLLGMKMQTATLWLDSSVQYFCQQPAGFVSANGDCNDADASIRPMLQKYAIRQTTTAMAILMKGCP